MNMLSKPVITKQDWLTVGCIAAGIIVVVVVVAGLVYKPQKAKMRQLDGEIAETSAELDAATETARRMDELERKLERIERLVARFEAKLPTRKEIPKLYKTFQLAASEANVVVDSIEKLDENRKAPRIEIPSEFKVSGSYHELASFINSLEMGKRFVKISDMHIAEEERSVSKADFKLTTYLFTKEGA